MTKSWLGSDGHIKVNFENKYGEWSARESEMVMDTALVFLDLGARLASHAAQFKKLRGQIAQRAGVAAVQAKIEEAKEKAFALYDAELGVNPRTPASRFAKKTLAQVRGFLPKGRTRSERQLAEWYREHPRAPKRRGRPRN